MLEKIKNGELVITHPTGVVDIYTPADIKWFRDRRQARLNDLQSQIAQDNILILDMEA